MRHCGLNDYCEANKLSATCCITDSTSWKGQCLRFGVLPHCSEERFLRNPLITCEGKWVLWEKHYDLCVVQKQTCSDNQDNKRYVYFRIQGIKLSNTSLKCSAVQRTSIIYWDICIYFGASQWSSQYRMKLFDIFVNVKVVVGSLVSCSLATPLEIFHWELALNV